MRQLGLFLLRVSLGWLMVVWGADKVANPAHGLQVARAFYLGVGALPSMMPVFGVLQIGLGLLVIAGVWRRLTYPVLAAVTAVTLAGVWRSVVDPWGWYLVGGNALFYPSFVVFAGVLALIGCRDLDTWHLGRR